MDPFLLALSGLLVAVFLVWAIRRAFMLGKEEEAYRLPPVVYARVGDIVTCENGHDVCDVVQEIHVHDVIRASHFGNWRDIEAPTAGDPLLRECPLCNGRFMKTSGQKYVRLNINGKWQG